jgi:hypothetical protein
VITHDRDLSGRSVPLAASVVGVSIAVADLRLNRPRVTIPENVRYNATVRAEWEGRNHSIATQNAEKLRRTAIRVRARRPS